MKQSTLSNDIKGVILWTVVSTIKLCCSVLNQQVKPKKKLFKWGLKIRFVLVY